MERYNVLGTKVSKTNINDCVSYFLKNMNRAKNSYVCCANVHTVITAYDDKSYQNILNDSFITLPDGGPIAREANKQGIKKVSKISGVDFFENVLNNTQTSNIRHFFYGTTKENIEKLIEKIRKKYPDLIISGYEPSLFRDLFEDEIQELREKIRKTKTDIVWVAIGAPKQELFCARVCQNTNACFVAVGGAFNVVAGITPRAPKWMRDHSLEWFYRFIKEPRRLFMRYIKTNTRYLFLMGKNRK